MYIKQIPVCSHTFCALGMSYCNNTSPSLFLQPTALTSVSVLVAVLVHLLMFDINDTKQSLPTWDFLQHAATRIVYYRMHVCIHA